MKPVGIDQTPLRDLRSEHAQILIIAIENWVFEMCSHCGKSHCLDWYLDLYDDRETWKRASSRG